MSYLKLFCVSSLILSTMLTAICWFNQFVTYPGLKDVSAADFIPFHERYTKTTKKMIFPLMIAEVIAFILMVYYKNYLYPSEWLLTAFLIIVLWIITYILFFKIHKKLAEGKQIKLIDEMRSLNWLRIYIWTLKTLLIVYFIMNDL